MDKIETDRKMRSIDRISNENTETVDGSMNEEQDSVIKKLEEALGFLKNAKIKNKESFANVKKPLEDFLSSLKYLPCEPSFEILPPEIKTGILGYLCDKEAYVAASVCQEWKSILFKTKLKNFKVVIIGKHCRNCKDNKCFKPEEILEASITLKLDIPLYICHPITDVDTQVITEALTSVSRFGIEGECSCVDEDDEYEPILTKNQFEKLFDALENKSERMTGVALSNLDLRDLNQGRVMNCLFTKTWVLDIDEGRYETMFDVEQFVEKLLHQEPNDHLPCLTLQHLEYPDTLSVAMGDALCTVIRLNTSSQFQFKTATVKRLIENILTRPTATMSLDIAQVIDWRELISPDTLEILLNKLNEVKLNGNFTPLQVEKARSVPGVEASKTLISKQ